MQRTRRREFLLMAAALAAAPLARAQAANERRTLGILNPHPRPTPRFIADNPFTNRLRSLGWVEGQNLRIERAYGEGQEQRLPELAAGLVGRKVDVIWASGVRATLAAMRLTDSIPIVFWGVPYPVEQGVIASLARPGGNVTGIAFTGAEVVLQKALQVLREIAPSARRLALLVTPSVFHTVGGKPSPELAGKMNAAAAELEFKAREFAVERKADFDRAFASIVEWKAEALAAGSTTVAYRERGRIATFANGNGIPGAYGQREFVEAGGLVSYGLRSVDTLERSADIIDRVLRGTRVAELPVELPTKYELAINLKAAAALGLTIPQSLLLRADLVIE